MYFPYFTILCLLHPAHRARRNTFFSDRQQSSDGHASRSPLSPPRRWSAAPILTLAEGTVQTYFEFVFRNPIHCFGVHPLSFWYKKWRRGPSISGVHPLRFWNKKWRRGQSWRADPRWQSCQRGCWRVRLCSPPPSQRTFKSVPPFPWDPAPGGVRPLAGRLRRLYAASWSSRVTESAPATAQAATAELDRAFAVTGRPARPSPHPFQGPPHTRSTRRLSGRQGAA